MVVDNECLNERNNEMEITREPECETMEELLDLSREAEDTDDEDVDPSSDLNSSIKSDTQKLFVRNGWFNYQEKTELLWGFFYNIISHKRLVKMKQKLQSWLD